MRLNADILYERIQESYSVTMYGTAAQDLCLHRPEFYLDLEMPLRRNHCYLSMADRLPPYPKAEDGCVLLVFGGNPPSSYRAAETLCILAVESDSMLEVFNQLQHVYDEYDEWENGLLQILEQNSSIQDMLEISFSILRNPMIVTDFDYHFLAYSSQIREMNELSFYRPDEDGGYSMERLSSALNGDSNTRQKKEPFLGVAEGVTYYCQNLFVKGSYVGNLKIPFALTPYYSGAYMICCYLGHMIERAFLKNQRLKKSYVYPIHSLLKELLDGHSIDQSQKAVLSADNQKKDFLCARLTLSKSASEKIPIVYMIAHLEKYFPNSYIFEYKQNIAAFILLEGSTYAQTKDILQTVTPKFGLSGGLSNVFHDLTHARTYWRQASIAITLGEEMHIDAQCHIFDQYRLLYMCRCSCGEFAVTQMLSPGLQALAAHDRQSGVSYLQTLNVYLQQQMNLSQTAARLYIHRTTLLERLKRIEALLAEDLNDPNVRLYLLLVLKQLDIPARTSAAPFSDNP